MRAAWVLAIVLWSAAALADDTPAPPAQPLQNICDDYGKSADIAKACDEAIAKGNDAKLQSMLLATRAYERDVVEGAGAFPASVADLTEALKLDPDNVDARHERAFIYNEMGRWKEAETDLDIQIKLLPNETTGYRERALSRYNIGDLQGAHDDRASEARLSPTPGAWLALAKAEMWLGHFDDAEKDIAQARALAASDAGANAAASLVSAQLTFWRSTSPQGAKACDTNAGGIDYNNSFLIGDCTRAFLDASDAKERAAAISARSLGWITGANDMAGFIEDSKIAAALDPQNPNLRSNLGFAYMKLNRPAAAVQQFDVAIGLEPGFQNYAGRALAKMALGDLDGAEADANKSVDDQKNSIALMVLGDVAYARTKTFDKAKNFWLDAYNSGPPDDRLVARLKAAGVTIPEPPVQTSSPASDTKTP